MKTFKGDLVIKKGDNTDYSQLTTVEGSISIYEGGSLDAPNLTTVEGSISIYEGGSLDAPNLTTVKESIHIYDGGSLDAPNLTTVEGYISIRDGGSFAAPNLKESGSIRIYKGASFAAPNLKEAESISIFEGASLDAPNLTESGSISISKGGSFDSDVLKGLKYEAIDNSLFVIESERTVKGILVYSGYNVLKITNGKIIKEECFVAKSKGFNAHGKTIKKAIEDVKFKIISDKLKKDPINKDTMISINYYHHATGSCILGIESWKKQQGIEVDEIRAYDLLIILESTNAYGLGKFKELINF